MGGLFSRRTTTEIYEKELGKLDASIEKETKWLSRLQELHVVYKRALFVYGGILFVVALVLYFVIPTSEFADKALWTSVVAGLPVVLFLLLQALNTTFRWLISATAHRRDGLIKQRTSVVDAIVNDKDNMRRFELISKVITPNPALNFDARNGVRPPGLNSPMPNRTGQAPGDPFRGPQPQLQPVRPQVRPNQQRPPQPQPQQPQPLIVPQQQPPPPAIPTTERQQAPVNSPQTRTFFDTIVEAMIGETETTHLTDMISRLQRENNELKSQLTRVSELMQRDHHQPQPSYDVLPQEPSASQPPQSNAAAADETAKQNTDLSSS